MDDWKKNDLGQNLIHRTNKADAVLQAELIFLKLLQNALRAFAFTI